MEATTKFSIKVIAVNTSKLFQDSKETTTTLNGTVLEGQWQLNNGWYLLCLTEDCPFEEAAHFFLLDEQLSQLDELVLGSPYTSGVFEGVEYPAENSISFSFDNKLRYVLTVNNESISLVKRLRSQGRRKNLFFKKSFMIIEDA